MADSLKLLRRLPFLYGTAWKADDTAELVATALRTGFRGIDTACQPKHYREDLVGDGIRRAISEGVVRREELFVQTKFTPLSGQDQNNVPYPINAPLKEQVKNSIETSLKHLRADDVAEPYIDSLVLHSPLRSLDATVEAWEVISSYYPQIRSQGISNIDLNTLRKLYDAVRVKPSVVQNRFFPRTGFDVPLRQFCRDKGIIYQSFWTLTANPELLASAPVTALAKAVPAAREVALYVLVQNLEDIVVLNGTTNESRMKSDLESHKRFEEWKAEEGNAIAWKNCLAAFRKLIGESQ